MGEIYFPAREFCFTIGETQFPNFPPISPEFPLIPPISQFPVQFSIQLHKCTLSLSIRPILFLLQVFLKMRPPHYARQRVINIGNSGEIQGNSGNSGEIRVKAFHFFSIVLPGVEYISLLGKSNSPDFSSGYRENW